jgi:hypothetical protein
MTPGDDDAAGDWSSPSPYDALGETSPADSIGSVEDGWIVALEDVNPYTNLAAQGSNPFIAPALNPYGTLNPYGAVSPYGNPYTGSQPIEPFTGQEHVYTSGALSNDQSTAPWSQATGLRHLLPEGLRDLTSIGKETIGGREYAHYKIIINGTGYDAYFRDEEKIVRLVPMTTAIPSTAQALSSELLADALLPPSPHHSTVALQAADLAASALRQASATVPTLTTAPTSTPTPPSFLTMLGDVLAGFAGIFDPDSVTPYLQPRTPANLPAGLQQMGQMNAAGARQSMYLDSYAGRAAMVMAGTPYVVATGAMVAPEVGALGFQASIRVAAQFPRATTALTEVGAALSETTLPRTAMTQAAQTALPRVAVAGAVTVAGATHELRVLAPKAGPGVAKIAGGGARELGVLAAEERTILQAKATDLMEMNALFGQKVQENANRLVSAMNQGDYSLLKGWLTRGEYQTAMRALAGQHDPKLARTMTGKAIERMVARAVQNDPRTAPHIRWVHNKGPHSIYSSNRPDFIGVGKGEGFFWDVTTIAGKLEHETESVRRWYASRTFVHAYFW